MNTHARRSGTAALALAAALVGAAPVAAVDDSVRAPHEVSVTITDLGVLGEGARARRITDSGVVIGFYVTASGTRAFRWEDGAMMSLPDLGGPHTGARDVNEQGEVVGWSNAGASTHAALWQPDGTVVDLGPAGADSQATGINRHGVVAGTTISPDGVVRAVIWRDGVMTDLGDLGGGASDTLVSGSAINDLGQVTGTSTDLEGIGRAFRWSDGTMTALPMPEGLEWSPSSARSINRRGHVLASSDGSAESVVFGRSGASRVPGLGGTFVLATDFDDRGQVVGSAATADGASHAFLATGDTVVDLGSPSGGDSEATAVNRRGQVVGAYTAGAEPSTQHAVLWDDGRTIELGTLGGSSSQALDINRHGDIVGWSLDPEGVEHAVMWTVDD